METLPRSESAPSEIEIHPLRPEDLDRVVAIEQSSFSSPWPFESFEAALGQPHCHSFAAHRRERLIGYVVALVQPPAILVANIAVAEDVKRQRLGTRLLEIVLERGREAGCEYSVLDVRPSNVAAVRLYESLGFRPVGRRPGYYQKPAEDALTMARTL